MAREPITTRINNNDRDHRGYTGIIQVILPGLQILKLEPEPLPSMSAPIYKFWLRIYGPGSVSKVRGFECCRLKGWGFEDYGAWA